MNNPPGHYAPEDCARCRATGISLSKEAEYCPTCGGQGSVAVLQPARPCARCGGEGLSRKDVDSPCYSCGGSGWAHRWIR
ncbi:MAG TPA: hypothetical protein VEV81_01200 [Pyrinomonadaceae bacterium]|nr:hypothetical protein [Pyrinomonadaceae bacterium]